VEIKGFTLTESPSTRVTLRNGGIWVLLSTIIGTGLVDLNSLGLSVALNAIQLTFAMTAPQLLWIANIYLLFLAAFILISGNTGDRFGRKRIYITGIGILTAASVACGLAPNANFLIFARAMQGFGGALVVPGSLAIITATFEPESRAPAIGIWLAVVSIISLVGPIIFGFLANLGLWRVIFFLSVPLIIPLFYSLSRVPETRDADAPQKLDFVGALTLALSLGMLTFGTLRLGQLTTFNQQALITFSAITGGILLFAVFLSIERRSEYPMLDLTLFKSSIFSGANLISGLFYIGLAGAFVFIPLNLIQIQNYSEFNASLAMLPLSLLIAVLSPIMGNIIRYTGPRPLLITGLATTAVGYYLLSRTGVTHGPSVYWTTFFPGILLAGIGMGILITPLTNTVMGAAPEAKSGTASGILNTVTRTTQALAISVLGATMIFTFKTELDRRTDQLSLPEEVYMQLLRESSRLGNIRIPENIDEEKAKDVERAIHYSFADGFRIVFLVISVLAGICTSLTWLLFRSGDGHSGT
jgi:EmrB/QacA subfamily drug resistance transporter